MASKVMKLSLVMLSKAQLEHGMSRKLSLMLISQPNGVYLYGRFNTCGSLPMKSVSKYPKPWMKQVKMKVDLNLFLSANTHVALQIKDLRALPALRSVFTCQCHLRHEAKKVACHYKIFIMEMLGNQSLGAAVQFFARVF
jgi:hypothetical protein